MSDEREQAWAELHAATPPGWYVGAPALTVAVTWERTDPRLAYPAGA